jgi:hypothetical protein
VSKYQFHHSGQETIKYAKLRYDTVEGENGLSCGQKQVWTILCKNSAFNLPNNAGFVVTLNVKEWRLLVF